MVQVKATSLNLHTFCCSEMKNEKYVSLILVHEECEFVLESVFAFLYDIISRQLQVAFLTAAQVCLHPLAVPAVSKLRCKQREAARLFLTCSLIQCCSYNPRFSL